MRVVKNKVAPHALIRYNHYNSVEGMRYHVQIPIESASSLHQALAHLINIQGGLALLALASLQHTMRAGPRGPARFFYSK
jgi:hypothetical protein